MPPKPLKVRKHSNRFFGPWEFSGIPVEIRPPAEETELFRKMWDFAAKNRGTVKKDDFKSLSRIFSRLRGGYSQEDRSEIRFLASRFGKEYSGFQYFGGAKQNKAKR